MFHEIWRQGLLEYEEVVGIDWGWLAADGAMTKAPLGGPKTGPNPTGLWAGGFAHRQPAAPRGAPAMTHPFRLRRNVRRRSREG